MITFNEKWPGITLATITNKAASAEISLYGGHILSYKPAKKAEVLFMSEKSAYEPGKPIRGGIPVCFPWFGPNAAVPTEPPHGFARTSQWNLVSVDEKPKSTTVIIELASSEATLAKWPHEFKVTLEITVGASLEITMTTSNPGKDPIVVTNALHTYYAISDIGKVSVLGLDKLNYIDRVGPATMRTQEGDVTITAETDRVYLTAGDVTIADAGTGRKIALSRTGNPDTVVWNCWEEKSKAIGDIGEGNYRKYICVEAGSVLDHKISVAPDTSVSQSMTIKAK
jgi:glucose-6-phosphate 1-epimerase